MRCVRMFTHDMYDFIMRVHMSHMFTIIIYTGRMIEFGIFGIPKFHASYYVTRTYWIRMPDTSMYFHTYPW